MSASAFDSTCAETQIQASNLSVTIVQTCMGSSDADQDHVLLKVRTMPAGALALPCMSRIFAQLDGQLICATGRI